MEGYLLASIELVEKKKDLSSLLPILSSQQWRSLIFETAISPKARHCVVCEAGAARSLYRITRENWDTLKPTAVISKEQLQAMMNAPVPFDIGSFWVA
ncbi:MAG: hypothetical protein QNJ60_21365 [Xenococcaceae cyanobacterium MO_188.B19]|nr:hypothetical protein [Xenococcaceae cyanobacterium MO_188.B19]